MKRKILWIFAISCLALTILGGCSGNKTAETEVETEYYADEDFMRDLAKGLEKRWTIPEIGDTEEYSNADKLIDHYTQCINAELEYIGSYKDFKFQDSKLQECAIKYINCLNESLSTLDYYKSDINKYLTDWDKIYNERSKLIKIFYNDFGLTVQNEYESILKDFLNQASTVEKKETLEKQLEDMVSNLTYECIEDMGGWRKYRALLENTTENDFNSINFNINLLDENNVIVESTYGHIGIIEKGQKAYVEFSSDKDFLYVKTDIQWYEIKE